MLLDLLLPHVPGIQLDDFTADRECIHLDVSITGPHAVCPICQHVSHRIHSRYTRQVADLPWAGIPVQVTVRVRRFFCDTPTCRRRLFCERLGSVLPAYSRRTHRLNRHLQLLAFSLGGETGARIVPYLLGLTISPDTLLRRIEDAPWPEGPTPRVLGVDDGAFRKGQTYGTLLVDLEHHRPVDLLPDRTAGMLADWLTAHPGVAIVARDRATPYAEGAEQGAPQAVQVADRFHLLQNLRDALRRILDHHPKALQETAHRLAMRSSPQDNPTVDNVLENPDASDPSPADREEGSHADQSENHPSKALLSSAPSAWKQARFSEVKTLQQQGWGQRAIARQLRMHRGTVKRYMNADTVPLRKRRSPTPTKVTPYWSYVRKRWQEGCHNAMQLFRELKPQGFTGSYSCLTRAVKGLPRSPKTPDTSKKVKTRPSPLSPRQVSWLFIEEPGMSLSLICQPLLPAEVLP